MSSILIIVFSFGNICAQHLFSVNYDKLSQDNIKLIRSEIVKYKTPVSTMLMTKNRNNKDVYLFSLSAVNNTKIIILNEETGNNVIITPEEGASAHFELSPFFIEELKQAVLGNADRYLVIEIDIDFSVKNAVSISATNKEIFIPGYFYGSKENKKEALPKDRQIVNIFKEKPRYIPTFPNDPKSLQYVAQLEEDESYYVYVYKFPDGTLCIYDEHFNPSTEKNGVSTRATSTCCTNLQFVLSGTLNAEQRKATEYALGLWSNQLVGTVPIDINVTFVNIGNPQVIVRSFVQPNFLDNGTYIPQYPNTWYSSAQWNQIVGYDTTTGRDIRLEMNTQFNFYFGLDGSSSSASERDYVTIALHEVTHGLGFYPLCRSNGAYSYGTFPGIYDRQLYQGATGNTCLTDLTQSQRATLVTSGNLYAGRPGSYLLAANGGMRVKMYAPNPWREGSSVSHWDNNPGFTNFMQYAYQAPLHTFNTRKIGIMRDMGWKIICPPSSVFVDFTNRIITTNTTVTGPCDIKVQNVKVQNRAKLILDATCDVNIISDFDVDLGSELEIR
jgi:hypothetical protein